MKTPAGHPVARRFAGACASLGIEAQLDKTFGGSDNNYLAVKGITGLGGGLRHAQLPHLRGIYHGRRAGAKRAAGGGARAGGGRGLGIRSSQRKAWKAGQAVGA